MIRYNLEIKKKDYLLWKIRNTIDYYINRQYAAITSLFIYYANLTFSWIEQ